MHKIIVKFLTFSLLLLLNLKILAVDGKVTAQEKREERKNKREYYLDYMEIENKIAVGVYGEYEYLGEKNESETNLEVTSETLYRVDEKIKVGLGASAQFRGRMKTKMGKVFTYDSLPLYLTYRYFPINTNLVRPYIKFNYGITFNHGEQSSKAPYYAFGIGIEDNQTWVYDLIYQYSEGKYKGEECSQMMLTLGIGYKIKF